MKKKYIYYWVLHLWQALSFSSGSHAYSGITFIYNTLILNDSQAEIIDFLLKLSFKHVHQLQSVQLSPVTHDTQVSQQALESHWSWVLVALSYAADIIVPPPPFSSIVHSGHFHLHRWIQHLCPKYAFNSQWAFCHYTNPLEAESATESMLSTNQSKVEGRWGQARPVPQAKHNNDHNDAPGTSQVRLAYL